MNTVEALKSGRAGRHRHGPEPTRWQRVELATLLESYFDELYRAAFRLTQHRPAAERLVEETLLAAWRSPETLRRSRDTKTWLFRLLVSIYLRECRSARSTPQEGFDGALLHGWILESQSWREDKELREAVLREISDEDICSALASLPPVLRLPVVLRDVAGFSYEAIAGLVQISVESAKVRLFAGRRALENHVLAFALERLRSRPAQAETA